MDAVIQVEASTLQLKACHGYVDVVVLGETTTTAPTWVTALIDELVFIKNSLWANAPNEPHINYRMLI